MLAFEFVFAKAEASRHLVPACERVNNVHELAKHDNFVQVSLQWA